MKTNKYKVISFINSKNGNKIYSLLKCDVENTLVNNCFMQSYTCDIPNDIKVGDIVIGNMWYLNNGLDRFIYSEIERS